MSYIQFESARDKEKARQELREARAELIQKAKERAELRSNREVQSELRGEKNWILPAIEKKLEKSKKLKKHKKQKKKKLKSKSKSKLKSKSSKKKKKSKNRKRSSSSESSSGGSSSNSDDSESTNSSSRSSSSSGDDETKYKHRKKKKTKRSNERSDSSGSSAEWVESTSIASNDKPSDESKSLQRDSWMTSEALMLKTFSRDRKEPVKPNERQQTTQIDAYDPAKSRHELNPYWKANGTGLPGFRKPNQDDDDNDAAPKNIASKASNSKTGNWRKPQSIREAVTPQKQSSSESASDAEEDSDSEQEDQPTKILTDEEINNLAAKAIRAELKGNVEMAAELNKQLENARKDRSDAVASGSRRKEPVAPKRKAAKDHVLLTRTDQTGNVRPLPQSNAQSDERGGRGSNKRKKKAETHEDGQRVRYFADDDRYDIKQMFEREKYATAADANLQFADIVSKHKNPNDDLEDIFADKVRKNISTGDTDKRELQRAIKEHERLAATLENCDRCFDSVKLDKQLLVSMGEKIYLALPWHIGLQNGHCILTSMQHSICCTQLDEDSWEELGNYRKALTRMFAAQRKDVVFYEIANKLHRRRHFALHCIPIPDSHAEMAPFYFKKAIEESEQEWSINKQLISLRDKSVRAAIPKGLPYVWVHFGISSGFAHVIEDQDRFPANFVQEIIGGMLELNPNTWRKPRREENSILKVKSLARLWEPYDCTQH